MLPLSGSDSVVDGQVAILVSLGDAVALAKLVAAVARFAKESRVVGTKTKKKKKKKTTNAAASMDLAETSRSAIIQLGPEAKEAQI